MGGANHGPIAAIWPNESLCKASCPARMSFEKAVSACRLGAWSGDFGWHGTKSMEAIKGICWSNLDVARRSGQAYGPGEYFSKGTLGGLHYSETYAGGDAGNMLLAFWLIGQNSGAPYTSTEPHYVVNNPTSGGQMYC